MISAQISAQINPILGPSTFRSLATSRLHAVAPALDDAGPSGGIRPPSDFDLNPGAFAEWNGPAPGRPAAVLVPIVGREQLTVLLTQRTDHLPAHAGQIAFPGGKPDPDDTGPVMTALRETREEIGLLPEFIEPIGFLDTYRTGTGFAVTPVVAIVQPHFTIAPNPHEVADVFEVPLDFLMNPDNHEVHVRTLAGRERHFYAMPYLDRYIWGATAGILRNMHEKLFTS